MQINSNKMSSLSSFFSLLKPLTFSLFQWAPLEPKIAKIGTPSGSKSPADLQVVSLRPVAHLKPVFFPSQTHMKDSIVHVSM